jgi:hypothetical protein
MTGSWRFMKQIFLTSVLAPFLLIISGCSGGNTMSPTTVVMAQTAYSAASLTGMYSLSFVSVNGGTLDPAYAGVGTIQFSGAGTITGGTINLNTLATSCTYTLGGTYSIASTALGAATVNMTSGSPATCPSHTMQLGLATAQQGQSLLFATSSDAALSGTAIKQ